jgi:hypothetical protein
MTRNIKLKDGSIIKESQKGVFSIIFPNNRYITVTTWEGKVKVTAPGIGNFEMGEVRI